MWQKREERTFCHWINLQPIQILWWRSSRETSSIPAYLRTGTDSCDWIQGYVPPVLSSSSGRIFLTCETHCHRRYQRARNNPRSNNRYRSRRGDAGSSCGDPKGPIWESVRRMGFRSTGWRFVRECRLCPLCWFWAVIWCPLVYCKNKEKPFKKHRKLVCNLIFFYAKSHPLVLETKSLKLQLKKKVCALQGYLIHGFHNSTVRLKTRDYSKFFTWFYSLDNNFTVLITT